MISRTEPLGNEVPFYTKQTTGTDTTTWGEMILQLWHLHCRMVLSFVFGSTVSFGVGRVGYSV